MVPVPKSKRQDPYRDLAVADFVMLSLPLIDPVHWYLGQVLWIADDRQELLVRQGGIGGQNPHTQVYPLDYVRGFGTMQQCIQIKAEAEKIVRDAARQASEVEDLARDLRRRLIEVFEAVSVEALRKCGAAPDSAEAAP